MTRIFPIAFLFLLIAGCYRPSTQQESRDIEVVIGSRWTPEKANQWYAEQGWLVGSNFSPSNAINQLEMWQAETFDTVTINRELAWAEDIGFNSMRVFLHHLLWEQDSVGFLNRMDQFLSIADKNKIGVMFVIFDGVWDPFPKTGKQRDPKPHLHNSGWVQSPGVEVLSDTNRHDELKGYVKGVIHHFANDRRVDAWDLFNEPDNMNRPAYVSAEPENKPALSLALLKKTFRWAREVNPSQPLTAAPWYGDWSDTTKLQPQDRFLFNQSDIISFHNYDSPQEMEKRIIQLQIFKRPVLCTEYMARGNGSTFQGVLPILKKHNVAAYNWGFVSGKTQTIYPWNSWTQEYTAEPALWFHDIFRKDGSVYNEQEVKLIKEMTGKKQ